MAAGHKRQAAGRGGLLLLLLCCRVAGCGSVEGDEASALAGGGGGEGEAATLSAEEVAVRAWASGMRLEAVGRYGEALLDLERAERLHSKGAGWGELQVGLERVRGIVERCGEACPWRVLTADGGMEPKVLEVAFGRCSELLGAGGRGAPVGDLVRWEAEGGGGEGGGPAGGSMLSSSVDRMAVEKVPDGVFFACEGADMDAGGKGDAGATSWHVATLLLQGVGAVAGGGGASVQFAWAEGADPYRFSREFIEHVVSGASDEYLAAFVRWAYAYMTARNAAMRGGAVNERAPPWEMPEEHREGFTMGGRVGVLRHYLDESTEGARRNYRHGDYGGSREQIEGFVAMARGRRGNYYSEADAHLYRALDGLGEGFFGGKEVVVMGSLVPWYEAVCIAHGATSVSTIEYNELHFDHPAIKRTYTVREWEAMGEAGRPRFDVALSVSSFEHDGLGRYGDEVNPDADLDTMRRMKGVVKEGGLLLLAVPCGRDAVVWNAHRKYGRVRLPRLLAGWEVLGQYGLTRETLDSGDPDSHHQPTWVVRNKAGGGGEEEAVLDWDALLPP